MLNNKMFKKLQKLNENNYKDFIKEFGIIREKKLAIDFLCYNCKAWYILSEELKSYTEVIMYYQPNGTIYERHKENPALCTKVPYPYLYDEIYSADEGFIAANPIDLLSGIPVKKLVRSLDGLQIPLIQYPEDFNFELYLAIQKEMNYCNIFHWPQLMHDHFIRRMIPKEYKFLTTDYVKWPDEIMYKAYDRSLLRQIVKTKTDEFEKNSLGGVFMFEDLKLINENNYESFIKKYGFITDTEIAKDALCVTCKAWYVLSPLVKSNADVIMYYQPNLYVEEDHNFPVGLLEYDAVAPYQYFGTFIVSDKGFVAKPDDNRAEFGAFADKVSHLCGATRRQQPAIQYPEDFNFELYYAIQDSLRVASYYTLEEVYNNAQLYAMLPELYQDKNGIHVGQVTVDIYNRSNLREIVAEKTVEYSGKVRQKH